MSLKEGKDYKVIYSCKAGKDEGFFCGFSTYSLEELEKHFLAYHPTSEQIAKIFGFLAGEGLNVDDGVKLLSEGHDLAKYALVTQTKTRTLADSLAECQRDLLKARLEEREACAKVADTLADEWNTKSTIAHKDAAEIIEQAIRDREGFENARRVNSHE